MNYHDPIYNQNYHEVPHGMTRQIIDSSKPSKGHLNEAEPFRLHSLKTWKIVAKYHVPTLLHLKHYGDDTWEFTIAIEFYRHLMSRANYLLDLAVSPPSSDTGKKMKSLIEAAAWLELAVYRDEKNSASNGLKKNLGLAYMYMVRNKEIPDGQLLGNTALDIFGRTTSSTGRSGNISFVPHNHFLWKKPPKASKKKSSGTAKSWKTMATTKWQFWWEKFLDEDDAERDSGYEEVKDLYEKVMHKVYHKKK